MRYELDAQIAAFCAREGVSKSAVIRRSMDEFIARRTRPTALQIYEQVMREAEGSAQNAPGVTREQRPRKLQLRKAIGRKHAERSARARGSNPST